MLQWQDPLLLLPPPYGGLSSLLPLSCGLDPLDSSILDSSLSGPTFTPADLASTRIDALHASMAFLDITSASTACMQLPFPVQTTGFGILQEPCSSTPLMASTQGLLHDTTQQLQLMDLSCSLLPGPEPASDSAPDALCAGFLQASTGPHMVQQLHLTGMQHAAHALDVLPMPLPTPRNAVDAGLLLGTAAAQRAGGHPGVVMGFPVAAQSLCMPAQAAVAQHLGPLIEHAQPSPVVASNGMLVISAPAPPA